MKKILSKLIILLLMLSMIASASFVMVSCKNNGDDVAEQWQNGNGKKSIEIGILADTHLFAEANIETLDSFIYKHYMTYHCVTRMISLSEAILKTAVDEMIAKKPDVVFTVGDLTENGSMESLNAVKAQLYRLEEAGIPVFITNGKCDTRSRLPIAFTGDSDGMKKVYSPRKKEFVEMFGDFGYSEAVLRDTGSASYLADIPDTEYSVLALDNVKEDYLRGIDYIGGAKAYSFSETTLSWIESALENAEKRSKKVLAITNTPLNKLPTDLFTEFNVGMYRYVVNGNLVEELLTRHNVRYLFQGEIHMESAKQVATANGTLNELTTSCLCAYPSYVKTYTIDMDDTITEAKETLKNIPESYIPSYISSEVKAAATTDYKSLIKKYYVDCFRANQISTMYNKAPQDMIYNFKTGKTEEDYPKGKPMLTSILTALELYPTGDSETDEAYEALNDDLLQWMIDVDDMTLYGENSVKSFCDEHNIPMTVYPEYANMTVSDYIIDLFCRMFDGTFIKDTDGKVSEMFSCIFYAGLNKFLSVDLFTRLSALNDSIIDCDLSLVLDYYLETDVIDLKQEDFLLSIMSLFKVYFKNNKITVNISDTKTILKIGSLLVGILQTTIPELALFFPNGQTTTSYCDLENDLIFGKEFISEIMMQVLSRTAIKI